jgi:hypothetical protein
LVVFGMMGRCPFAGQTWLSLNWLRGFQKLGHEVWYVEDDACWPFDPIANGHRRHRTRLAHQPSLAAMGCVTGGTGLAR